MSVYDDVHDEALRDWLDQREREPSYDPEPLDEDCDWANGAPAYREEDDDDA